MKILFEVTPTYKHLQGSILQIPEIFESHGVEIYKGRNVLKKFSIGGYEVAVKQFKIPNLINKYAYGRLRKSKAHRSFDMAQQLLHEGILTPEPIGFVEYYEKGKLQYSYYLCHHIDYDHTFYSIHDNNISWELKKELIEKFTYFTIKMHEAGFWSKDHSRGNTLIKRNTITNDWDCYIVDLNRIIKTEVSPEKGRLNFERILPTFTMLEVIAKYYSSYFELDYTETLSVMYDNCAKASENEKKRNFLRGRSSRKVAHNYLIGKDK